MRISEDGIALIKRFEGVCLEAYLDSVRVWTIGYGHTQGVKEGDTCTADQANEWLKEDVHRAENCVAQSVSVDLTQGEFDACVSFIFNLGCGAFLGSTLLRLINDGRMDDAAAQFVRWSHAGGVQVAGLVKRREAEAALFTA